MVLESLRITATDFDEFPDNVLQKTVINCKNFRPGGWSKSDKFLDHLPSRPNKLLDPPSLVVTAGQNFLLKSAKIMTKTCLNEVARKLRYFPDIDTLF